MLTRIIGLSAIALTMFLCSPQTHAEPATKPPAGKELATDDGKSAGQKSIAGSGHGIVLDAADDNAQVTAVKIFGARYGTPAPPKEDFSVWVCDGNGKEIKEFKFPYKTFTRGDAKWVTLPIEPTKVPKHFMIYVAFNPEQTKGVYVNYDATKDGDSRTGVPGDDKPFDKGDWMIRAVVADAGK